MKTQLKTPQYDKAHKAYIYIPEYLICKPFYRNKMNSEISITANDTIHSIQSLEATARPAITFIHHFIFKLSAIVSVVLD